MKRALQVVVNKVNVVVVSVIVIIVVVLTVVSSVVVIARINGSRNVGGERIGSRISQRAMINDGINIAAIEGIELSNIRADITNSDIAGIEIVETINAATISSSHIEGHAVGTIEQIHGEIARNIGRIFDIEAPNIIGGADQIELIS